MNIWKYLIAASLGNMIAGPLGALAFTAGAFFLGKKNSSENRFTEIKIGWGY